MQEVVVGMRLSQKAPFRGGGGHMEGDQGV